ncbi:hypothetical protein H9Q73_005739 [Fusarium xylarioides]|nr:hypothetical protein H9Q73_005739 [Fusarium xylarioides]
MSSIQKLVNHWKQELNGDDMIVPEITKGISILKDVVEALKITQEFNKDLSLFSGNARDVLISDDFLLVADVLRLIFPEGMISDVWQLKRGRDEDLDTRDDPMPKRLRFTNGPEAQENKTQRLRFTNGPESQPEKKPGLFGMPASQAEATGYTGIFRAKDKNSLSTSQ